MTSQERKRAVVVALAAGVVGIILALTCSGPAGAAERDGQAYPYAYQYGIHHILSTESGQDCIYEGGFGLGRGAILGGIGAGAATPPLGIPIFVGVTSGSGATACVKAIADNVYYEGGV